MKALAAFVDGVTRRSLAGRWGEEGGSACVSRCALPIDAPARIVQFITLPRLDDMRHDHKPAIITPQPVPEAPVVKPTITVRATWAGAHLFDTGRPGGPTARFDGSAKVGQNPVDALVSALSTCVGIDVVDILAKRRTPASALVVDAHAERRATHPRRVERVTMTFRVDGEGVDVTQTERAVELALERYCSVAASLAPDIVIETIVVANGSSGAPITHGGGRATS